MSLRDAAEDRDWLVRRRPLIISGGSKVNLQMSTNYLIHLVARGDSEFLCHGIVDSGARFNTFDSLGTTVSPQRNSAKRIQIITTHDELGIRYRLRLEIMLNVQIRKLNAP